MARNLELPVFEPILLLIYVYVGFVRLGVGATMYHSRERWIAGQVSRHQLQKARW